MMAEQTLQQAWSAFDTGADAEALRLAKLAEILGAPSGEAALLKARVQARRGQMLQAQRALDEAWEALKEGDVAADLTERLLETALGLGEVGRALSLALEQLAAQDHPQSLERVLAALRAQGPPADLERASAQLVAGVQWMLWWQGRQLDGLAQSTPMLSPQGFAALGQDLAQAATALLDAPGSEAPPPAILLHLAVAGGVLDWLAQVGGDAALEAPAQRLWAAQDALCTAAWRGGLQDPVQQFALCGRRLPAAPEAAQASLVCAWLGGQPLTARRLVRADPQTLAAYDRGGGAV